MSRVRIRIAVGNLRVDYAGTMAFYERVIAPLVDAIGPSEDSADAGASAVTDGPAAASAGSTTPPSASRDEVPSEAPCWTPAAPDRFAQFASQVGARAEKVDQRIMAFAFYVWNYEKRDTWNAADVGAFFRTLHEDPPEDLGDRLAALTSAKRFLEEAGEGSWKLSTKGVNYVKNRLLA